MMLSLVALHTAEEPSPHQLRRANTTDGPIGVQHQPDGMITERTQKISNEEIKREKGGEQ